MSSPMRVVTVNHRYAPDRSPEQAHHHMQEVFDGCPIEIVDNSPGHCRACRTHGGGGLPGDQFAGPSEVRLDRCLPLLGTGDSAVNFGPGILTGPTEVNTCRSSTCAGVSSR